MPEVYVRKPLTENAKTTLLTTVPYPAATARELYILVNEPNVNRPGDSTARNIFPRVADPYSLPMTETKLTVTVNRRNHFAVNLRSIVFCRVLARSVVFRKEKLQLGVRNINESRVTSFI